MNSTRNCFFLSFHFRLSFIVSQFSLFSPVMQRIREPETCIDTYNQQNRTKYGVVKYMFLRLFTDFPAEVINAFGYSPLNPVSFIFLVHLLLKKFQLKEKQLLRICIFIIIIITIFLTS